MKNKNNTAPGNDKTSYEIWKGLNNGVAEKFIKEINDT